MAKKSFDNPLKGTERKGIDMLISDPTKSEQKKGATKKYTTSNVRISDEHRVKVYTLKGQTGLSITEIYNMIFDYYFKNNPI
ncbi:MAG: hypothetical protein Q4G63_12395 [Bacteroidia bacterium]|nr:hypothetical protein [Bacteroidia bacterium]